jgi:uncharacterized protein with ParB-like and HNH nuclease domain
MSTSKGIDFDDYGIATAIQQHRLMVPVNQRSYKWEEEHVRDLFTDLETAIDNTEPEYFLGTMVFTRRSENELEVADGQQRLATIVMLLAAFRDYLSQDNAQKDLSANIQNEYLASYDLDSDEKRPHLTLNTEDNDYFQKRIIVAPNDPNRINGVDGKKQSHVLINGAANIAREWVSKIVKSQDSTQRIIRIKRWLKFLKNSAQVIFVVAPDPGKAFTIFETLNDRGLKLSQVDLLKNHLYGLASTGKRLPEAQQRWDGMVGALESTGNENLALDYIRQLWISYHGYKKEAELYNAIKEYCKSPANAIDFAGYLSINANPFTALLNPKHPLWSQHTQPTAQCVDIMLNLRIDRIRPLMLSIVQTFNKKDVERAYRLCVSWAVRFLIVGGIGSGTVEQFYASAAKGVRDKTISTPEILAREMKKHVPSDSKFREAFSRASVARSSLARYYLRVLERQLRKETDPALAIDDETERTNLEHVIPQKPSADWRLDDELRESLINRIGNVALLEKKANSTIRGDGLSNKIIEYKKSTFQLTQQIEKFVPNQQPRKGKWGKEEIDKRQAELAKLAVKAWPITV